MKFLANITRTKGDPEIIEAGPTALSGADRLTRALGWFSLGLGLAELLAPHRLTRWLGIGGRENLVRAYGAREIAAGMMTLSPEKQMGLKSRVAGDGLDIATLVTAMHPGNPQRRNVELALVAVLGVTVLDYLVSQALTQQHARKPSDAKRDYSDRSGFPKGVQAARGVARNFKLPADMRSMGGVSHDEVRGAH